MPAHAAPGFAKHDRADFAQEFLRRSPAYRAAWATAQGALEAAASLTQARRWGLERLFDPDRSVRTAPAIWRAECASQIVSLVAAPSGFGGAAALPDFAPLVDFSVAGTRNLVFDIAGARHRFRLAEPVRILHPSVLQRQRLALLLRVLDASLGGASNREIGTRIVYPWLAGTDAVAWKATSERRRVQRLLDEAHGLSASAYRDLLTS